MLLVHRDESQKLDFVSESEPEQTSESKIENTDDSHRLLGGGESEEEKSDSPNIDKAYFRSREGLMFDYCICAHAVCFVLIVLFLYLKKSQKAKYYNLSQFIQAMLFGIWNCPMLYIVYVLKIDFKSYILDLNEVRCWLLIEIIYMFVWIFSSSVFLIIAYYFKIKSVAKHEDLLMLDDDVWNDKDTDDFLRYLKYDYYIMNYVISFFGMELVIGFTWVFNIHLLGPKG